MLGRGGGGGVGSNSPNTRHQQIYIMHFIYPTQLKWGDSKNSPKKQVLFYIRSVNYMMAGASFSGATKETKPLI